MKTKIIAGLAVIAVMLSAGMMGCGGPTDGASTEESEKKADDVAQKVELMQVSVGEMTLSVPTSVTWEHMRGDFLAPRRSAIPEGTVIDGYNERWKDVMLYIGWLDKKQAIEAQGASWQGWEATLEAEGKTKEQYIEEFSSVFLLDTDELTRTGQAQLTIQGSEALELQHTGLKHDEPAHVFVVAIFGENDIGILAVEIDQETWKKHKETWYQIRDSVQLP